LKEAFDAEFAATIERAEKQIILAKHGRRLLKLLDDTPVVPGDTALPYDQAPQARQILNDAEDDLRAWQPEDAFSTPVEETPPSSKVERQDTAATQLPLEQGEAKPSVDGVAQTDAPKVADVAA
jgi:hypothetical protein